MLSGASKSAMMSWITINTLRPRQNGRHFPDDILKCIFLNKNVWILIKISLKFVPKVPIYNIPALVQIMACRWPGDKTLSELMMVRFPTHICVTWPQWVDIMKNLPLIWNKSDLNFFQIMFRFIPLWVQNPVLLMKWHNPVNILPLNQYA